MKTVQIVMSYSTENPQFDQLYLVDKIITKTIKKKRETVKSYLPSKNKKSSKVCNGLIKILNFARIKKTL